MRTAAVMLLCSLAGLCLDNSKTLHNRTGAALTEHPFTLHYWLAQGEIPDFPRPYATPSDTGLRVPADAWQADVKTRWRDGSATRAIGMVRTSAPSWAMGAGVSRIEVLDAASGMSEITFSSSAPVRAGDRLQITGATVDADFNRSHYIVLSVSGNTARVVIIAVPKGVYTQPMTVHWVTEPQARAYCWIDSANHGFEVGEEVTVSGVAGISGVNGTWRVSGVHQNALQINTTCSGTYTGGGTVSGPGFGSVRTAHVSLKATVPAGGSVRVDIVNSASACHLGDQAACSAAGLDKDGMLNFNGGAWNAQLEATAAVRTGQSTGVIVTNARDMLAAWNGVESYCSPRYWLRGPVVTQLILEHGCQSDSNYDFGWKIVPGDMMLTALATTSQTVFHTTATPTFEVGDRLWFVAGTAAWELMRVEAIEGKRVTVTRGFNSSPPYVYGVPTTAVKAAGPNTGNGTIAMDASEPVLPTASTGVYTVTCIEAAPDGGVFEVKNPAGAVVGQASVGVPFADQISFTLNDGATDYVVGDGFRVTVPGYRFGVFQFLDAPDNGYKSLHPVFTLTYYSGWPGVKVETRVENTSYSRVQTTYYAPAIKTGPGLSTRWSGGEMKHPQSTFWRKVFWDGADAEHFCEGGGGTDPDACSGSGGGTRALQVRTDHNTEYLIHSKALPAFQHGSTATTSIWVDNLGGRGFKYSDKGQTATARAAFYGINGGRGLTYLGGGTWGADGYTALGPATNFPNGTQEGGLLPRQYANWVQAWDIDGYELAFGVSVPGGGGNSQVQNHIPYSFTEQGKSTGVIQQFVFGWDAPAYNRILSPHARPGNSTSDPYTSIAYDTYRASQSCWTASSYAPTPTERGIIEFWPCRWHMDGWSIETAHMNDWTWVPWLITGDEYHWRALMTRAGFSMSFSHNDTTGRPIGKPWAWSYQSNHIREESFGTQSTVHALAATPTEPLFGATGPPAERHLLNAALWDGAMFMEGIMEQTDGWAAILYGPNFSSDCAGYVFSHNADIGNDRYRVGRCKIGYRLPANPLRWAVPNIAAATCAPAADCTKVSHVESMWMPAYTGRVQDASLGYGQPQFTHSWRGFASFYVNALSNSTFNGYLTSNYRSPSRLIATGTFPQTWAEFKDSFAPSYQNMNYWAGYEGIGYMMQMLSAAAVFADYRETGTAGCSPPVRPGGCSGQLAYNWTRQTVTGQHYVLAEEMKFNLRPRPAIQNVRIAAGAGGAVVRYTAPDSRACVYRSGTDLPDSSLDWGDTPDGGGSRERTLILSGLAAGTTNHLRLTCGAARRSLSFQTLPAAGMQFSLPVKLRAPSSCGPECHVRLERSLDGGSWSSLPQSSCDGWCTVPVDARKGELVRLRITYYRDSSGTVRHAGPAVTAVMP